MNAPPDGIADTLATLDPVQVASTHAAARRLSTIGLATRIRSADGRSGGWYLGDNFAFRPATATRAAAGAAADDLVEALDLHDALLAEIEAATGYATEFSDHGALGSDAAAIQLMRGGEQLGELVVHAVVEDGGPLPSFDLLAIEALAARLSLPDAEALGPGDMVLLSRGPWPLTASVASMKDGFALDPATGRLGSQFPIGSALADHTQDALPMPDPNFAPALTIPVSVRLGDMALSAADIATLTAGGTVDLGPVAEGLHVHLSVGGRIIGSGEIVRLGDRFGVLLEDPGESGVDELSAQTEHD